MALNISAWSIRQPLPSVVLSIILLLLGWASFMKLPITRLPAADIPVISVVVCQCGAVRPEPEVQATKYVEDSVLRRRRRPPHRVAGLRRNVSHDDRVQAG